ncbi:MAG: hypothetical protein KIT33_01670 [Candidatus Kapabacteria bacterium]|nr:hypothetical protein [Ignavibacteriota bacterium]MCW5883659.1 hypothetical protein [Candidatus Kapabacteria bacterium]
MSLMEKFSTDEIENLKLSVIRVFNYIADIDGKIDKKEVTAIETFLKNIRKFNSELLNELFVELPVIGILEEKRSLSGLGDREGLRYISALLDRKIDREEALNFKKSLIALGYFVADSSGSFFEHNISDDENSALNSIAKDLDLSLREMISTKQIQRLIESMG